MTEVEIVRAFLAIPYSRRVSLVEQVKHDDRKMRKDVMARSLSLMEEMLGCPLDLDSRKEKPVVARMVLSYYLRTKGCLESEVARLMGKTSSNVHLYCDQVEFELSKSLYTERTKLWRKFIKYVEEHEN